MRILHIFRSPHEGLGAEVAAAQRAEGHQVAVLLIQDAVLRPPGDGAPALAAAEDVRERPAAPPREQVDAYGIVKLMAEADRVAVW